LGNEWTAPIPPDAPRKRDIYGPGVIIIAVALAIAVVWFLAFNARMDSFEDECHSRNGAVRYEQSAAGRLLALCLSPDGRLLGTETL
jgi:hypothetical protein